MSKESQHQEILGKIAIALPSLGGGGMERVQIHLAKEWIDSGIDVDLIVGRFSGPLCEEVPPGVRIFTVSRKTPFLFPVGLASYLLKNHPRYLLSAGTDVNVVALILNRLFNRNGHTVVTIHTHLSSDLQSKNGLARFTARASIWFLKRTLHYAQAVVAVSNAVAEDFKSIFNPPMDKVHVIYNPVMTAESTRRLDEPLTDCPVPTDDPWVLFVGRLDHAKGLDVLLSSFELVSKDAAAHLIIMGDGPLKERISAAISGSTLRERMHLVSFQTNPLPWMRQADVLVLPSRHEGLGNVLIEAMACGTQVISTNCPGGPREILDGGRYGQLVPVGDAGSLAIAILNTLSNRVRISPTLLRKRAELFSSSISAGAYLRLLQGIDRN